MDMDVHGIFLGKLVFVSTICKGAFRTGGPEMRAEPGATYKLDTVCKNRNQFATMLEIKKSPTLHKRHNLRGHFLWGRSIRRRFFF